MWRALWFHSQLFFRSQWWGVDGSLGVLLTRVDNIVSEVVWQQKRRARQVCARICTDLVRGRWQFGSLCNNLGLSVLFLFVFSLFIIISLSVPAMHSFCHIPLLVFPSLFFVFMLIWARTQPEFVSALFGYFRDFGIFIELPSLLVFWNFPLLP